MNVRIPSKLKGVELNDYLFHKQLPPHFYSGPLFRIDESGTIELGKPKMIFVLLNPRDDGNVSVHPKDEMHFNNLIEEMNNWFESPKAEKNYPLYNNCERFISEYFKEEKGLKKYWNLRKNNACIVDLFPFYSVKTDLKIGNELPGKYLNSILEGLSKANCPLIIGGKMASDLLKKIYGKERKNGIGARIGIYEINNQTIYSFSALSGQALAQRDIKGACRIIEEHLKK
ncbi:MAG: hypothetical protein R2799_16550 [Crocinitomicaceae bacterium]